MSNFIIQFPLITEKFQEDILNKRFEIGRKMYNSFTAQKIASNLWKAYHKMIFDNGTKIHYKKYNALNSLEGKSNKTGIKLRENQIVWNGLKIPVDIKYNNEYEYQAIQSDIAYCRIIRKFIKNKYKFYVQVVFSGIPPIKTKSNGDIRTYVGHGDVGIDIGTQTIAISSKDDVKIYELADGVQNIEDEKTKLLRKLDRSRRENNPNNYNLDGRIKKQGNKKVLWVKSNKYIKTQNKLKELYRKQADIRKYQHECLANEIIKQGDKIYVETMNFRSLQKRAKETTISEKTGKINKMKRFGKSLANKAPAMLLTIIDRKLKYSGNQLNQIDTWSVKASQYNHTDDTYTKKKPSERWNNFNGIKVQRDIYSAFLIMNVNTDLKNIDREKCTNRFDEFIKLHDSEVIRLSVHKNLSSIAI